MNNKISAFDILMLLVVFVATFGGIYFMLLAMKNFHSDYTTHGLCYFVAAFGFWRIQKLLINYHRFKTFEEKKDEEKEKEDLV